MQNFQFIALTPAGLTDPSIAIAASRAGELGALNLEHTQDIPTARQAVADLTRYTNHASGLKFDSSAAELIEELTIKEELPEQIRVLILTPWDPESLSRQVPLLRQRGFTVLLEVTEVTQAEFAQKLKADGLIAKGHEAGGWVGTETTFILLQHLISTFDLPVWAYGGIGLHTAAACYAAGAVGVVLDTQLNLTRESHLPEAVKSAISAMDGSETICLGPEGGQSFRVYHRPTSDGVRILSETAINLTQDDQSDDLRVAAWRQAVNAKVGWGSQQDNVWPLDQAASFAEPLARRYRTVGGILGAMRQALKTHIQAARKLSPLNVDSPLAQDHNIRYPIVQGPMTRVSDRAEFALRVAEGGGLPFLALALMHATEVETLLEETKRLLGDRPWGVGILGFVPLDLRQEQMEVIRKFSPPYALIAGGRPDQARVLEDDGIPTYLHVPSPGLLRLFLQDGARRFVFEGWECGGHVGPRSSFVLWNTMVDVLLEELPVGEETECYILFAGGIHDRLSAAMVAALAAPLTERGIRIGILMGTAYLFTEEAVTAAGIVPGFQAEALRCENTVLLESGPGHATRCVSTPYVDLFRQEKLRLQQENGSSEEIRFALEKLNVGRLRIASKGITRHSGYNQNPAVPKYITVSEEEQHRQGMYMIGQVAALRDRTCTIADLHHEVADESTHLLNGLDAMPSISTSQQAVNPSQIAIIGMSALLPKARNLQQFWENILNRVDTIVEVPKERWDVDLYYDPDRNAADKIYSKAGGFLDDIPFDPLEFGIPPNSLPSIDPMHLLALIAARDALTDAGYAERPFDRSRTSVILGASGGTGDLGANYLLRSGLPLLFGEAGFEIAENADALLPKWTEDSFAGLLLNVAAGRIANRFDFGGLNYVVDAACASSLAAVHLAVKELETHSTDIVLVGGVDTVQNPFGYLCFSKTQALSPSGQPRVFDATGDGIVISEGVVMLVLKRLADAERDGDRIYAVISAVNGSSDGRAMGMTAPRPEGQTLALERAYTKAAFSPATVGLFEAHGTGTVVGDRTEATTLSNFLEAAGAKPQNHAIGSVKSMIGHTKATAGVAGMAKVASALYHKILPPTLGVTEPNPKAGFGKGPLYVNSETRPWIHGVQGHPRRAGVSAFGFGGTNFHAVLEEYTGDFMARRREAALQQWPSELLLWSAQSRQELLSAVESVEQAISQGTKPRLCDLAYTLWQMTANQPTTNNLRLSVVTSSLEDLQQKLASIRTALKADDPIQFQSARGIYFTEEPLARAGKIAYLFPGQGSQYPNMLRDLSVHFPEIRETFERAERALVQKFPKPLSSYIFPPPAFTSEEERAQQKALTRTNVAQPALGAADMAIFRLLQHLGIQPDLVAGHSYGEYAALCAAGVIDLETLASLSEARGQCIIEAAKGDCGTMAAIRADAETIGPIVKSVADVWIANLNAPNQTIISGTENGVTTVVKRLQSQAISARPIPVACAFHSPLMAPAQSRLADVLSDINFAVPSVEIYSNTTAEPYPPQPREIRKLLAEHLVRPVRFADQIEAMYAAGAQVFIEVGPSNVLTKLVDQILGERLHLSVAVDLVHQNGLSQLQHVVGQLAIHGVPVQLWRLFEGRDVHFLDLKSLEREAIARSLSPTTWLVNGSRSRPINEPENSAHRPPLASTKPPATKFSADGKHNNPMLGAVPAAQPKHVGSQSSSVSAETPSLSAAVAQSGAETEQVMVQFQQTMDRFLETQRNVILTYLQHANGTVTQNRGTHEVTAPPPSALPHSWSEELEGKAGSVLSSEGSEPPSVPVNAESDDPVAPPQVNRERLTEQLLQVVGERTGYPSKMLDLDVDIEANLGIDSIKRVEILGILQRDCIPPDRQIAQETMEELTSIRTLRGIIDWLENALQASIADSEKRATLDQPEATTFEQSARHFIPSVTHADDEKISRSILTTVELPPVSDRPIQFDPDRVILITDDGHGISAKVAKQVHNHGGRAVLVGLDEVPGATAQRVIHADLTDPVKVSQMVATVRQQQGPIGGIIHLLPLRDKTKLEAMDLVAWKERLRREVKSLFHLVRAAAEDLKEAGKTGRAWAVATTAISGEQTGFPGQAGIAGLIKTLALEWPAVECKVVNLDLANVPSILAGQVFRELVAADGLVEVSYKGFRRQHFQPVLTPLDQAQQPALTVESDWVVLVTGGARGITAEVAYELAKCYQPVLLLAGSSPPSTSEESSQTSGLTSPQELKAALMEQMRRTGEQVTLVRVEEAYNRLQKEREIRRNLARMQRAGAIVHYYQVDVRNESAMAHLIKEIYQQYGRLDGVIHGAGIIEDKLVEEKTPDSFDRVFDTKADSAFILSRILQPDSLKFLAFFSSVAGLFGNRGQSDYAGTNEVLNKLAIHLDRIWRGRVVSINWGPWAKAGMVSPELQRQFAKRDIHLISIPEGCRMFDHELQYGRKHETEVILAGGAWSTPTGTGGKDSSSALPYLHTRTPQPIDTLDQDNGNSPIRIPLPLLQWATFSNGHMGSVEVVRTLNPSDDLYLQDHQLDGKPVFPVAMAMELMAEVVQHHWPGLEVASLQGLQILKGLILENGPKKVRVVARATTESLYEQSGGQVDVGILDEESGHTHYRATIELADTLPSPQYELPALNDLEPFPISVEAAYQQWLFHGPLFQGISEIQGISPDLLVATCRRSSPRRCLANSPDGQWLIDPVVFDSGLQLIILWCRAYTDKTPLPSRFNRYQRFGSLSASKINCYLHVPAKSQGQMFCVNIAFVGPNGRLLGLLEDMECPSSKALNRLAGSHLRD